MSEYKLSKFDVAKAGRLSFWVGCTCIAPAGDALRKRMFTTPAPKSSRPLNSTLLDASLLTFVPDKGRKVRVTAREAMGSDTLALCS